MKKKEQPFSHFGDVEFDIKKGRWACSMLIEAYCRGPEEVDWSDIQDALMEALGAFGLPENYPETEYDRRMEDDDWPLFPPAPR